MAGAGDAAVGESTATVADTETAGPKRCCHVLRPSRVAALCAAMRGDHEEILRDRDAVASDARLALQRMIDIKAVTNVTERG